MSILETQLKNNQLFHAYIFEGENEENNLSFAKDFAKEVFRINGVYFNQESTPDLYIIDNENEIIDINTIRSLTKDIYLSPTNNKIKIYIIHNAHNLRDEGSNALLKTIEELKDYNMIIFTATNADLILKTIRSRCQIINVPKNEKRYHVDMVKLSSILKDIYQKDLMAYYLNKDFFDAYKDNKEEILDGFIDFFQLLLLYKYEKYIEVPGEVKFNLSYLSKMSFDQIEDHLELINIIKIRQRTNINYDLFIEEIIFNIYKGGMLQSERSGC